MSLLDVDLPEEPDEAVTAERSDAYATLLGRLNRLSVTRHFEAYVDIEWDDPAFAIDPTDSRWALNAEDGLGSTEWYRALPPEQQARIGLHDVALKMKLGLQFESILKRGLLEWASRLPNQSDEFRYAYHEVIEEAQHALMFQEFVNRSGFNPRGMSAREMIGNRLIVGLGTLFPQLFFVFVLGGEDPIDDTQRRLLRSDKELHPLLERIMRIHVTEEARHLSFARHYLRQTVPQLGVVRRTILKIAGPLILSGMARIMMEPGREVAEEHAIPADVLRAAYRDNPEHRARSVASLGKVRDLYEELGLLAGFGAGLWRRLGLDAPQSVDGLAPHTA
jgi:hypothetical protein